MIGLSPLSTAHPNVFQHVPVRPSTPCYRRFSLAMDRSLGFGSASGNCDALFTLAFASAPPKGLTLLPRATRRLIMQKACGHPARKPGSHSLEAHDFRFYFTPLSGVLFTFPSRYWFAIGHRLVFSLGGWSPQIQSAFHVCRPTRDTSGPHRVFAYRGFTFCAAAFQKLPLTFRVSVLEVPQPPAVNSRVWAFPRSLATTSGISVDVFSSGY